MFDKIKLSVFESIVNNQNFDDEEPLLAEVLGSRKIFTQNPTEIGYFTQSGGQLHYNDTTGLGIINIPIGSTKSGYTKNKGQKAEKRQPLIGTSLSEGFDDYQRTSLDQIYSLDDLFESIHYLLNKGVLSRNDLKFLTLRRHLQKLMNIPLDRQLGQFNVIYWKELIFFTYDWENSLQKEECTYTYTELLLQYSGFKFEQLLTDSETISKYFTVVKHKVNGIPVIYTAEIDCGITKSPGLTNYVELKTHSHLLDNKLKTKNKFHHKLMKTYCQNKFISCKNAVVGFRSADFKLTSVKKYTDFELAKTLRASPIFLTRTCSINTDHIFQWYKLIISWICERKIEDSDECQVFKLSFKREGELMDSHLCFQTVKKEEANKIFKKVVPTWFREFCEAQ
ncbi:DXO1 [Candida oxycetoniae]|uniref:Decapping nuclease n=1 Tax=Candida oxycetoniae TaxID=497107 RepID=A0AAI9SYC7_9ASCO|nr:DXO1 [Candida oxycetoniae]KAI3405406.2 DXO1 [Candida oxycetoniae]